MARWVLAAAVAATIFGCAPSLRAVQRSRVYFERCYAADFDARIAAGDKHACWSAWVEHYTVGQPQERVDYARSRLAALLEGESVPRLPGIGAQGGEETVGPAELEPAASRVPDHQRTASSAERRRRRAIVPRTSNALCAATACEDSWRGCYEGCPPDRAACLEACDVELRACARGCF